METLVQDLRYALRQLGKQPVLTAIIVLTLGLAVGANTAIFSVLNGWLLRPLPVPVLGGWGLSRAMVKLLVGIPAADLLTFSGVSLLLAVTALLACYLPARRATKVDPMAALRYE